MESKRAEEQHPHQDQGQEQTDLSCGPALFQEMIENGGIWSSLVQNPQYRVKILPGFLRGYCAPGTSQDFRLIGERKCLHWPPGCTKCPEVLSEPRGGVCTCVGEPKKVLQRR